MKIKKHKLLVSLVILVALYFFTCYVLYFFEPIAINEPDLNNYQHYFDSYSKFSEKINADCYIKQIRVDDVVSADDKRIKYVKNTVIGIAKDSYSYRDVTSILDSFNYKIVGRIPEVNFYQISFGTDMNFEELLNICQNLTDIDVFEIVIPDYFEETPVEESTDTTTSLSGYYYDMLNLHEAWDMINVPIDVNIGVIDFYIDSSDENLNIINSHEYSVDKLHEEYYSGLYKLAVSHGTHVAGIIGLAHDAKAPGVIDKANIYSYNGINVSTSYWIASIYDMVVNNDIKVINVSMGYNPYITMSAALGCENAISHIEKEKILFSCFLSNLIDNGYEFVICAAAGNENNDSAYRIFNGYFSYGDKNLLNKLDLFGIFDIKPEYVDASYSYFFSGAYNDKVSDRTLIVGAIDKWGDYCDFSCVGNVDIASPGTNIYSTVIDSQYEYMTGTSMATPFVAGAAAMVFAVNPDLSGVQVKDIIISSATETVATGMFSYPVLNVGNAVKTALSS